MFDFTLELAVKHSEIQFIDIVKSSFLGYSRTPLALIRTLFADPPLTYPPIRVRNT